MSQIYNFYAGPAVIAKDVLERAKEELLDFRGTGMSVLEISHRAKAFDDVMVEVEANVKQLLGLGDDYRVLFLQGGASTQFSMVPMNFLPEGRTADYIVTGSWSQKALKEAKKSAAPMWLLTTAKTISAACLNRRSCNSARIPFTSI